MKNIILQLLKLNITIILINIIIFSPGLLGVEIGGTSIFFTALGTTVILMSIIIFIAGNYNILTTPNKEITIYKVDTPEECIEALKENKSKRTFANDIDILLEQIDRFDKKKETIYDILLQKFNSSEMSYSKFKSVIVDIEELLYINIKSVINKINIFDQQEYDKIYKDIRHRKINNNIINEKKNMYEQYVSFVRESTEDNEQILLKLDKVLLELSKFNSLEDGELENMNAMKDIDDLITKIKLYK